MIPRSFLSLENLEPNYLSNPILVNSWDNNPILGNSSGDNTPLAHPTSRYHPDPPLAETHQSTLASTGAGFQSIAAIEQCFFGVHMGHSSTPCRSVDESESKYFLGGWFKSATSIKSFIDTKDRLQAAPIDCPPCGVNIMKGSVLFQEDSSRGQNISLTEGFLHDRLYYELMTQWPHAGLEIWKPLQIELLNGINSRMLSKQNLRSLVLQRARCKHFHDFPRSKLD